MSTLREDIQSGHFARAYLIYGPESYYAAQTRRALCDAVVAPDDTMNRTVYEGRDINEGELIDQAETLPFFGERRLIIVRDSGFLRSGAEALTDYLPGAPDYLTLVFTETDEKNVDKKSRLYRAVARHGTIEYCDIQTPDKLKNWIGRRLKAAGKQIREEDALLLIDRVGQEMGLLRGEVDKLIDYTGDRPVIEKNDILATTTQRLEDNIFHLINAVSANEKAKALNMFADLLAQKTPPQRVLSLITNEYRRMYLIRSMRVDGADEKTIASDLAVSPRMVHTLARMASKYKPGVLRGNVELCARFDEDIKNGRYPDRLAVELLLIALA